MDGPEGSELLFLHVSHHVRAHPSRDPDHGVQHSPEAGAPDGDPGEQGHPHPGSEPDQMREGGAGNPN